MFNNLKNEKVNVAASIDMLRKVYPEVYKMFFIKTFKNVERFHNYNLSYYLKALSYLEMTNEKGSILALLEKHNAFMHLAYGFPTFFIDSKFFNALILTEIRSELNVTEIKMPFDNFTVLFEKDYLKISNENICYVDIYTFAQFKKNKLGIKADNINDSLDVIRIEFVTETGRIFFKSVKNGTVFDEIDNQLFIKPDEEDTIDYKLILELDEDENTILNQLARAVINLLFVMNTCPEYVQPEKMLKRHKKKLNNRIYSPNIIGANYRIKTEKSKSINNSSNDIERVGHWRRGHTRRQHYGTANKLTKIIWIEPTYIGKVGKID